jgi:hypothetical protein
LFDDQANPGETLLWTITYDCDGAWTAAGPWPGLTNNGDPLSLSGTGDCTGASIAGSGATGTIQVETFAIVECAPPGACCETWSGDEEVVVFEGSNFGDWSIILIEGNYPIVGNGCEATATILCRVTNALFSGEWCDVAVQLTLEYDYNINGDPEQEGCRWHYVIPNCVLQGGEPFPGDKDPGGAVFECLGGQCEGANGTCGSFLAVELLIDDPDASIDSCNDPNAPAP